MAQRRKLTAILAADAALRINPGLSVERHRRVFTTRKASRVESRDCVEPG
jgi:hypothetical protein